MSSNNNTNKRNSKSFAKVNSNEKCSLNSITDQEFSKLLQEAFLLAIQQYDEQRNQHKDDSKTDIPKNKEKDKKVMKEKWYINLWAFINILFFPWHISKKVALKEKVYDSVLVSFITVFLLVLGTLLWITGIIFVIIILAGLFAIDPAGPISYVIPVLMVVTGSFLIISSHAFAVETDSIRIYAYSASIMTFISCVIGILSFLCSLFVYKQ